MKTYLLKRSKHYLFILTGGFIGMLLALMVNKKLYLNHNNIYLFKWMGIGLLISEVVLFTSWFFKKDKN
ncbi:hypothetical protein J5Y03_11440 [Bacillus sp. RG28]|uniref:Uncharacterized protein n=1 Tax=Gottfriedia endophytica TaxID=2820819 RepID=A0A940NS25_9BACI|nr:hypothetical protein [Gottfriedia endophytica]MBP0725786.1 hypothetical protein [Gottfriedia endophytica]